MDKVTSRVCMSISAKAMSITGIEDRRYWNWIPTEESRFYQLLTLHDVVEGLVWLFYEVAIIRIL